MRRESAITEQERREYYKRNLVFWGLFLGFIPAAVAAAEVTPVLRLPALFQSVVLTWFFVTLVAAVWRMSWRCPRCSERFYYKWWYGNSFSTKCVHCGFRPGAKTL